MIQRSENWKQAGKSTEQHENKYSLIRKGVTRDINQYHKALGHPSEAITRATAHAEGILLKGNFSPCEDCALGKARQANVSKKAVPRSTNKGERLFIDISSPSTKSMGGKQHWLLIVDDCTDYCWSYFLKEKSDLKDHVIELIKEMHLKYNCKVKCIRCDNAGENISLEKACKQEGLGVFFEYTAPGTPQQNGRVERKFATLYNRVRAMLNGGKFSSSLRNQLWAEAAQTATVLQNSLVSQQGAMSPYHQFFGKRRTSILDTVQRFGEICIVANQGAIMNKMQNRGKHCIWLGFADNHASKCYRLLNLETKRIVISRDVIFLDKSFGDWANVKDPAIVPLAAEMIDTIDENNEVDAPTLVPPHHVSADERMVDDDGTYQGDDFHNQVPSILKHGILMMKILMMMDHKKQRFKWILEEMMQLLMKMRSMSNQGLKPQLIQKY